MSNQNVITPQTSWISNEIRKWIPTVVIFISAVGFFVTQSNKIEVLEAKANEAKIKNDEFAKTINDINVVLGRLDTRTSNIEKNIEEIKVILRRQQ